jgi:hypothetical protein
MRQENFRLGVILCKTLVGARPSACKGFQKQKTPRKLKLAATLNPKKSTGLVAAGFSLRKIQTPTQAKACGYRKTKNQKFYQLSTL